MELIILPKAVLSHKGQAKHIIPCSYSNLLPLFCVIDETCAPMLCYFNSFNLNILLVAHHCFQYLVHLNPIVKGKEDVR